MKKNKHNTPGRKAKVYVNLALSKQETSNYGTRPHGGRKGISNHYPPSRNAFASESPVEFLKDVKNMVYRQMVEEDRGPSPQWVGKYNKELNHTGEQPLMVQKFLSNNKKEQEEGVLPAHQRPLSRFQVEREDDREYQRGLSLHQYLTATEMPGQSEKLVDVKHGRPTRTSLLRARQRAKSAPGPDKTKMELRDDIHHLQEQTIKREEKYKSVDVPDDLQPLTDTGESVHQFLVGARYNRAYYHDAKCFNKVGLYVSRENPQHCFLKNGVNQDSLLAHKTDKANGYQGGAYSEVTASELNSLCQSTSSLNSLRSQSLHPPAKARPAWGVANGSINSAPSPTPNDSHESFAASFRNDHHATALNLARNEPFAEQTHKTKHLGESGVLQTKRIHAKNAPAQQSTGSVGKLAVGSCESCILCQEGAAVKSGVPAHFHGRNIRSAPSRRKWTHGVTRGRHLDSGPTVPTSGPGKNRDLMMVQQYHLRILGTQMDMKMDDRSNSPRSKEHYTPGRKTITRPRTAIPIQRRYSKNKNRSKNNNNTKDSVPSDELAPGGKDADTVSTSSRISVHISTGDAEGDGETPREGGDVDQTPRSQDVLVGSPREGDETPRSQDVALAADPARDPLEAVANGQESGADGERSGEAKESGVAEDGEVGIEVPKEQTDCDPSLSADGNVTEGGEGNSSPLDENLEIGGGDENGQGEEGVGNALADEMGKLELTDETLQQPKDQELIAEGNDIAIANDQVETERDSLQRETSEGSTNLEQTRVKEEVNVADDAKSRVEENNNVSSIDAT